MAGRPDEVNRKDLMISAQWPRVKGRADALRKAVIHKTAVGDGLSTVSREEASPLGSNRFVARSRILSEQDVHCLDRDQLQVSRMSQDRFTIVSLVFSFCLRPSQNS